MKNGNGNKVAIALLLLAVVVGMSSSPVMAKANKTSPGRPIPLARNDWQYGLSMQPTTSTYNAVEMPTAGMHWSTAPSQTFLFWVSSTTQGSNFAQDGFAYGGSGGWCPSYFVHCIPANSWGMFYTYTVSGTYHGDGVPAPSGWNSGDHIYFSIATYPTKGEFSFEFTDSNLGQAVIVAVCHASISGQFTGNVGGLSEGFASSGFGNIYVDRVALWAEVISTGTRNSGPTSVYSTSDAPSNALIYVYSPNVVQVGFNTGTHYSGGTVLWTNTFSAGNEDVPPDKC